MADRNQTRDGAVQLQTRPALNVLRRGVQATRGGWANATDADLNALWGSLDAEQRAAIVRAGSATRTASEAPATAKAEKLKPAKGNPDAG